MDLSLSFSSPQQRTSKFDVFNAFKVKGCNSNVMHIPVPMENDSSNSVFGNSNSCGIDRVMLRSYNSNYSYLQKSFQINKSNASTQKVMISKMPSITVFSQQTIVGGFVGSKSHAGRSFSGGSSQLGDAIMRKFMELMSLNRDKTSDNLSIPSTASVHKFKTCDSASPTPYYLDIERSNHKMPENISHSSAVNPKGLITDCRKSSMEEVKNRSKSVASERCELVESAKKEKSENRVYVPHSQRETYSSVVDRTSKKNIRCVQPESSPAESTLGFEQPEENLRVRLASPLKQSYAEVAKSIPSKLMEPQKRVGCEVIQNFKRRILHSKPNRDKKNWRGSPTKVMKPEIPNMDYIIIDGDTRWRADCKSKRFKFQRSHPIVVPSKCLSSVNNENSGKDVVEINCSSDSRIASENGVCVEAVRTELPKCGLRGRHLSECSLDSEDSFVVFEDSPEVPVSSSPHSSTELSSSLEVDEEFAEDESNSSSDDSDSEDSLDHGDSLNGSPVALSKLQQACCKREKRCPLCTVPENTSKVIQKKKVHFAEGSCLAVIRPMIAWGYAYRESRRGQWEIYARDRARFRCRIDNLAPILNLVLDPKHRKRIFASRFSDN